MKEFLNIVFPFLILFALVLLFIRLAVRLRKKGGSLSSVMFGGTWELHNADRRAGIREIIEQKTDKKKKEDDSGDPGIDELKT